MFVCCRTWQRQFKPTAPGGDAPSGAVGDTQLQNNSLVIICMSYSVLVQEVFVKHGHLFAVQGPPSSWGGGGQRRHTLNTLSVTSCYIYNLFRVWVVRLRFSHVLTGRAHRPVRTRTNTVLILFKNLIVFSESSLFTGDCLMHRGS